MFNKTYSPYQFSLFRLLFGVYLFVHFVYLIPYAGEIWSSSGILPQASLNLSYGYFPNILNYADSSFFVTSFIIFLALLSLLFCLGTARPVVALLLWYGWACLFNRNNLISNPGIPFTGWLLLVMALIPRGEPWTIGYQKNDKWSMPHLMIISAWLIMSVAYSISGVDKILSASWQNGTAIQHLLSNPLARDTPVRVWLLASPLWLIQLMTWSILFVEVAFLPLALFSTTRKWIWLAMISMHLGILVLVDFADLTFGMLMIHLFTFDASWIKAKKEPDGAIVFFDGVCGLCNHFINLLLNEDKNRSLQFSPLQGRCARELLPKENIEDMKTVVFYKNGAISAESDAVLDILKSMGGIWSIFYIFKLIPKYIRDKVYQWVSRNRIRWFGQLESCRMPTKEERARFID